MQLGDDADAAAAPHVGGAELDLTTTEHGFVTFVATRIATQRNLTEGSRTKLWIVCWRSGATSRLHGICCSYAFAE